VLRTTITSPPIASLNSARKSRFDVVSIARRISSAGGKINPAPKRKNPRFLRIAGKAWNCPEEETTGRPEKRGKVSVQANLLFSEIIMHVLDATDILSTLTLDIKKCGI
jgi:hypothetical protein